MPDFGTIRRFRQHFLECLALAVAAYPEALVSIGERGIILRARSLAGREAAPVLLVLELELQSPLEASAIAPVVLHLLGPEP